MAVVQAQSADRKDETMKWVAVVDDNTANLNVAGQILSKNHIRVSAMRSGAALIKFIRENRPDLILLDIVMPQMDGFETLTKLRETEKELGIPEIPVVFLTADEESETESRGFEMGVSDYIRKPFYPEVLLKRIENVIAKQEKITKFSEEAATDKLTGFLNKVSANERIAPLCTSQNGLLIMLDLDCFKLVNDIYGHDMGDRVLTSFAQLMRSSLPEKTVFGRIGGDEFIAFCADMSDDEFTAFAGNINDGLMAQAKELMGEDVQIPLGISAGAVRVPEYGTDYAELFRMADKALYSVKQSGKHGSEVYSDRSENTDSAMTDISTISMILDERNIPNCALKLDRDAFIYVYRFVLRYMKRYKNTACKLLFTIDKDSSTEVCESFGEHIKYSLRKSDIMMQYKKNRYFVLLPEVKAEFAEQVAQRICGKWAEISDIGISYELEIVSPD